MPSPMYNRSTPEHKIIKLTVLALFILAFLVSHSLFSSYSTTTKSNGSKSNIKPSLDDVFDNGRTSIDVVTSRDTLSVPSQSSCVKPASRGSYSQICAYVKSNCVRSSGGYINYLEMFYCSAWMREKPIVGWFSLVAWVLFLFLCLGIISNDYFVPALTSVSYSLSIPAEIAGLTLLAFGNGSPNVVSYFAAVTNNSFDLAIGDIFGGTLFIISVVLASICLAGRTIRVDGYSYIRDILFLVGGIIAVFIFIWTERFYIYESIGLLVYYLIYVLYASIHDLMRQRKKRLELKKQHAEAGTVLPRKLSYRSRSSIFKKRINNVISSNKSVPSDKTEDSPEKTFYGKHPNQLKPTLNNAVPTDDHQTIALNQGLTGNGIQILSAGSFSRLATSSPSEIEDIIAPPLSGRSVKDNDIDDGNLIIPNLHKYQEQMEEELEETETFGAYVWTWEHFKTNFSSLVWYGKFLYIFLFPIQIPLLLTIPTTRWNRANALSSLVFSWPVLFGAINQVTSTFSEEKIPVITICVGVGLILAIVLFFLTETTKPPKFRIAFLCWGFLVSIAWIYLIASELVNVLQAIGTILSISDILLGATILTVGNSISDFIADTALARRGEAKIAMGALYGGPMFNVVFGIGTSTLYATIKSLPNYYKVNPSILFYLMGAFVVFLLWLSLIFVTFIFKFRLRWWLAFPLIYYFIAYLVVVILHETGVIWK